MSRLSLLILNLIQRYSNGASYHFNLPGKTDKILKLFKKENYKIAGGLPARKLELNGY
jgi:hypothetical protein